MDRRCKMKKFLLVFVSLFILIPSVEAKTLGELKKELENFELEQKEAEYNRQLTQIMQVWRMLIKKYLR